MEITDRVALMHCVHSSFYPRALRTEVWDLRRVIRACYRCHIGIRAHRCIREEKCNNELNSRGELHWLERKKGSNSCDRREYSQSWTAGKSAIVDVIRGMKWCRGLTQPIRMYKTHRSAEVSQDSDWWWK